MNNLERRLCVEHEFPIYSGCFMHSFDFANV